MCANSPPGDVLLGSVRVSEREEAVPLTKVKKGQLQHHVCGRLLYPCLFSFAVVSNVETRRVYI
jgi:hypothetical protein